MIGSQLSEEEAGDKKLEETLELKTNRTSEEKKDSLRKIDSKVQSEEQEPSDPNALTREEAAIIIQACKALLIHP